MPKLEDLDLIFLIDRSGSMYGSEEDTIEGFNSFIKREKAKGLNTRVTTILFDDNYEMLYKRKQIEEVKELTENEYWVRGCTALLDAIGGAVRHIANVHKYAREEDRPEKTLFIITTDGMENASHIYDYKKVKSMIEKQKEKNVI